MKIKFLVIIGISVTVFLIGTAVYPFIYEATFDDDFPHDIQTAIDDIPITLVNTSQIVSKITCMNIYQQSLDNSLHRDEYRKNFVAWLTQCNENGYLSDTDISFYLDTHYSILDMTCDGYAGISPRFTSDLERYAGDIKYDECNPDENWLEFKYGSVVVKNEN